MTWFTRLMTNRSPVPEAFLNVVSTRREDSARRALESFLAEDPALRDEIVERFTHPGEPALMVEDKHAVAKFLTRYAMTSAGKGDYRRASSALLFALLVIPDFLDAVTGMAIIYYAWEDQIAMRWAEHFLALTSQDAPVTSYLQYFERATGDAAEDAAEVEMLRAQMLEIVGECRQHPEWRDSSADLQRFGMSYQGRYGT